jgi:nucleoside-diphosphate-sugar epimerase
MKAFVTGGTGFIGGQLVRRLVERGDEVYALARSETGKAKLAALGATVVWGDITDCESMREGMRGSDVVFHLAAWYKLGASDWRQAHKINVEGTHNVLGLAFDLGVPKIVYTSTVAVFGDTHGQLVDETYQMPNQPFVTEYDRTKWLAHYEVALPLIARGAPIVIVMPGAVYGLGDTSLVGQMMQAYLRGWMVFFPGPETVLTYAHVDDIVTGHLLAAEKGRVGESYVLAGPAAPLGEIAQLWSRVSGRRAPLAYVPARLLRPLAPLAKCLGQALPMPEMLSADAVNILGATYIASAAKAQAELGWQLRPLEDGMRATLAAVSEALPARQPLAPRQRQIVGLAFGLAVALMLIGLLSRRGDRFD